MCRVILLAVVLLAAAPAQEPSKDLRLTVAQKLALRNVEAESAAKAASTLANLAEAARKFNANLLSEAPDPQLDEGLGRQMSGIFAAVIQLREERIRAAAKILTPEQRRALAEELKKPDGPSTFDELVTKVLGDPRK